MVKTNYVSSMAKEQKVNEKRIAHSSGVTDVIVVSSFINTTFYPSANETVEAHLYGQVITSGELEFSLKTIRKTCIIRANIHGGSAKGRLQLDVLLPRSEYERLTVENVFSAISIKEGVNAKFIDVSNNAI